MQRTAAAVLTIGRTPLRLLCAALAALAAAGVAPPPPALRFTDVTAAAGIDFVHHHGGRGRHHLPETMGSGVGWIDYDRDGAWDLYFVDSGPLPDRPRPDPRARPRREGVNALYRGAGDGTFKWVPGVAADPGYGKGVAVGDYDNDGFDDLFVTNWGRDRLYRNLGDGTFADVSDDAGLTREALTSSAAFADFDGDGWLDLAVVTYVRYDIHTAQRCAGPIAGTTDYCHPAIFDGQADLLYRNAGDGTFADRSAGFSSALARNGKGLALGVGDLDGTGGPDVYVANDTTPNFVYLNRGDFRFEEEGELSGLGLGADGLPQAGMGVGIGDLDGDGQPDLVVTNFEREPYNLFRRVAPGFWVDDTYALGLGETTAPRLGFGVVMADLDLDGDLDLAMANGHILETVTAHAQANQLFENRLVQLRRQALADGTPLGAGWRPRQGLMRDVSAGAGEAFVRRRVSRGLAAGDADGDGRAELAVSNVDDAAALLHNDSDAGGALVMRLRGRQGPRDPYGATVEAVPCAGPDACAQAADGATGFLQRRFVPTASSYQSQNAADVVVGLGPAAGARVAVVWPGGAREEIGWLPAGQLVLVQQGQGVIARRPLRAGVTGRQAAEPLSGAATTTASRGAPAQF